MSVKRSALRFSREPAAAGLIEYAVTEVGSPVVLAIATNRRGGYWRARNASGTRHSSAWCRTRKEAVGQVLDLTD